MSVLSCGLDLRGRGRAGGRGGVVGESGLAGDTAPWAWPVTLGERVGDRSLAGGEGPPLGKAPGR